MKRARWTLAHSLTTADMERRRYHRRVTVRHSSGVPGHRFTHPAGGSDRRRDRVKAVPHPPAFGLGWRRHVEHNHVVVNLAQDSSGPVRCPIYTGSNVCAHNESRATDLTRRHLAQTEWHPGPGQERRQGLPAGWVKFAAGLLFWRPGPWVHGRYKAVVGPPAPIRLTAPGGLTMCRVWGSGEHVGRYPGILSVAGTRSVPRAAAGAVVFYERSNGSLAPSWRRLRGGVVFAGVRRRIQGRCQ